jgi:Ca2+-binding RTX toxin-like protein
VTNVVGIYASIERLVGNGLEGNKIVGTDNTTAWSVNTSGDIVVGTVVFQDFRNIEAGTGTDTLTGPASATNWTVIDLNRGTMLTGGTIIEFSGVENVIGSTADDAFEIQPGAGLTGNLNGGGGTGLDSLSYADWITDVSVDLSRPSTVFGNATGILGHTSGFELVMGGAGDDSLVAGSVAAILIGGLGNDSLRGGAGRDILIGGLGADIIQGLGGEDILIAGWTTHDLDRAALFAIRSEWTNTSRNFATRVDNLRGVGAGVSLNGNTFLNDSTVFEDLESEDQLTGGLNQDWFWSELDEILDLVTNGTSQDRVK